MMKLETILALIKANKKAREQAHGDIEKQKEINAELDWLYEEYRTALRELSKQNHR